jgi:Uma2 family endonuclease
MTISGNRSSSVLRDGDRMTRVEFHHAYAQAPQDLNAELVEGIVRIGGRVTIQHGSACGALTALVSSYVAATPGTEAARRVTVLLGDDSEPQPDLVLRITEQSGGQSATSEDDYVRGAPELIVEVANGARSIEFHAERRDYSRHGVKEYIVHNLECSTLHQFDLPSGREVHANADGVVRSLTFPGLWIDSHALAARDFHRLTATLQQGLASPEHAAFVQRLAAAGPAKPAT